MEALEVVDLLTVESVLGDSVGPDAPTVVHANGSKESRCIVALDVVPLALRRMMARARGDELVAFAADTLAATPRRSERREGEQTAIRAEAIGRICDYLVDGDVDDLVVAAKLTIMSMPIEGVVFPIGYLDVGKVLAEGEAKYGGDQNWRGIPVRQHLRHALTHLMAHQAGDRSEGENGHLARAVCRMMFAIEVALADSVSAC